MTSTFVIWLTGLSGSGKTTLAKIICDRLNTAGRRAHHLDGDEVRARAGQNLGFSPEDRNKNITAAVALAKDYQRQGMAVVASFISPYVHHRDLARQNLENLVEVFVDAPLEVCEARDTKGLYKKARAGEVAFFTGISDPYEIPPLPDVHLRTDLHSAEKCADAVLEYLKQGGFIDYESA